MSDICNVVIGVLAGGFVTYLVQILVEKQKLMMEHRARLLRLSVEIRAALEAIAVLLAAVDQRRNRPVAETYVRGSWDSDYDVPASLTHLQGFSDRLRPDADWYPLLSDESRDRLLQVPRTIGRLRRDVADLAPRPSSASAGGSRPDILERLQDIVHSAAANDRIDDVLTGALTQLQGSLKSVERSVEARCDDLDTWFTRPHAA